VRTDGGYRPTGPIETLEVPRTLHALIASRLDGLDSAERRLLQDASVLGRTFYVAGLAAISGMPPDRLEPILSALVRKEMLSLERDPMSPERGQYGFLQDIVRRVAYETLSRRDRRPRHLAAAEFLESASAEDEDVVEVVASHRLEAYLAVPDAPDAAALRKSARDALVRAGERASSLGAMLSAQGYFVKAASLADEPVQRAELLERAGVAASAGANSDAASAHFDEALEIFNSANATNGAARVSARRAEISWDQGRLGEALASMDKAFQLLAQDEPDADLAALAAQIGRFAFFAGNIDLSRERIETALSIAERLDLSETFSQALNTKGLFLLGDGRVREAHALIRHSLDVAIENDKPSAAMRAYNNLSDTLVAADDYIGARQTVDAGVLMARRVGNRYWEQNLLGTVYPLYALGEWQTVLNTMQELRRRDEHIRSRVAFTQGLLAFSVAIHTHRGEIEAGQRMVQDFAALADSADVQERTEYGLAEVTVCAASNDWSATVDMAGAATGDRFLGETDYRVREMLVIAVEAALANGEPDRARDFMRILSPERLGRRSRFAAAQTLRLGALIRAAEGDGQGTEDDLVRAESIFKEISYPYWRARTLLDLGRRLAATDRAAEAAPAVDESRGLFAALGASRWLDIVERETVSLPRVAAAAH
jgi:tetratricopeptide (TPR) repeat protein